MKRMVILALAVGVCVGAAAGLGGYTFFYAHGLSYMTDDPNACANCHVMQDHFDAWIKSSHKNVATCNDCHTPHNLIGKYTAKSINGYNHSRAFTTGDFHEPIRINEYNHAIVEQACRYCHADVVHAIDTLPAMGEQMSCVRCHDSVGHMR